MKKIQKISNINLIGSIGEDLKESIDDFVFIVEKIRNDVDEIKKEIRTAKRGKKLIKK